MTSNAASSSSNTSGKSYSLAGRNLKLTTGEDIQEYISEIDAVDGLEEIHLGSNTLGVGACQAIGKALSKQKSLKVADFADIFTGRLISEIPDALRALCDSLVGHESLVEMNLSDNAFGGRSAEPMVQFLTHNHHFSVLKLNNNGLGVTGGQIVANALFAAAEELDKHGKPSQLKTVICGRNRLEDGSAPYWAKAFAAHKTLEEVRMFQNGIRMDGIIALAQGLASCPGLRVLDLQDNTATVRGSRGIAAALPIWTNLETLNLSDCLLKPRGGFAIVQALSKGSNEALRTLQLQYCDLDRKVLDKIGSAIGGGALKNIEKLEINGNWADEEDDCIENIKKALAKHGHEDALDELDEMDPEGEDDGEEEDEEEGAESADFGDKTDPSAVAAAATAAAGVGAATAGVSAAIIGEKKAETNSAEAESAFGAPAKNASTQVPGASTKEGVDEKSGWASKVETEHVNFQPQDAGVMSGEGDKAKVAGAGAAGTAAAGVAAATLGEKKSSAAEADPVSSAAAKNATPEVPGASSKADVDDKSGWASKAETDDVNYKPQDAGIMNDQTSQSANASSLQNPQTASNSNTAAAAAGIAGVGAAGGAAGGSALASQSEQAPAADGKAASNAAEVAEVAQEVPEEKDAAANAAEVAQSAQQVPETDSAAALKAHQTDVSAAAAAPGVAAASAVGGDEAVAGPPAITPVMSGSEKGKTADFVGKGTARTDEEILTSAMHKATIEDNAAKGAPASASGGAVDLSGELYSGKTATSSQDDQPKKKGKFRAALGAVKELLK